MTTDKPTKQIPLPLRILLCLSGGLSLVDLIKSVAPLELYGVIRTWVGAYDRLVEAIGRRLLGWFDFGYIAIDKIEYHAIVLGILTSAAAGRAHYSTRTNRGDVASVKESFVIIPAAHLVVIMAMVVLFQPPVSVGLAGFFLGSAILAYALGDDKKHIHPKEFRREVLAVLSTAALIILVNYAMAGNA